MHLKTATNSVGTGKTVLILFAPKFTTMGCHVGREFVRKHGGGRVFGLCTGPESVSEKVSEELGELCGQLWRFEEEEPRWLAQAVSEADLRHFDRTYGPGVFGKTIVADRRVGRGFVRGGLTRPDVFEDMCSRDPDQSSQRYIVGLYKFLLSVYDQIKPDVVFCYAVAGAPALAMAEVCKLRDIAFTQLVPARLENRFMVDNDELGLFEPVARRFAEARKDPSQLESERCAARRYIESFRQKPEAPDYQKYTDARLRTQSPWKETVRTAIDLLRQTRRLSRSNSDEYRLNVRRSLFKLRNVWRKHLHGERRFSGADRIPKCFMYFPLHVDPEASTMVKSPWHTDQVSIIEALAKSMPAHLSLVVKEHRPMLGLRPKGFYEQISRMPRVVLLGPEHDGLALVRKAEVTAVITGTAAWEAMCLGKPALVIGTSPFLAIGEGAVQESCPERLPEAITRALSMPPASDEVLETYVAALFAESFELPISIYWGTPDEKDEPQRIDAAKRIATDLVTRMEEKTRALQL